MPPPTQMQQGLGTGGVGMGAGGLNPGVGGGTPNPYSLGDAFNAHYGHVPTHALATQVQQGQAVGGMIGAAPHEAASTGVGATNAVPADSRTPSSSPQDAGTLNSMDPGHFTGHPANGYPAEEEGHDRRAAALRHGPHAAPPQAPPPAQTVPPPPPAPPATPPAPAPGQATPEVTPTVLPGAPSAPTQTDLSSGAAAANAALGTPSAPAAPAPPAAAANVAGQSQEAAAPPPADNAKALAEGSTAGQSNEPAAPPPDTSATTQAGNTVNLGGVAYTVNAGSKFPKANWDSLTPAQKQTWISAHATPVSAAQQAATSAVNKDPNLTHLQLPTDNSSVKGGQVVLDKNTIPNDILNSIGDPSLRRLADVGFQLWKQGNSAVTGGPLPQLTANEQSTLSDIQNALGQYGIYFGSAPSKGPGGGGGNTGGTDNTDANDGKGIGNTGSADANANVATGGQTFNQFLNYYVTKGYDPTTAAVMAQEAMSSQQEQLKEQNTQTAATGFSNAATAFDKNPLYTGAQALAGNILKNPDPTDWEKVKNKAAATSDATFKTGNDQLSADLARRGLGATGGAEAAGELGREHANDLATQLGNLDVTESQQKRAAEENALSTGLSTLAGTAGQDTANAAQLSNIITGGNANYTDTAQGAAAAISNIEAQQQASRAADKAGQFSIADAISILGIVAAPFTGGLSLAATAGAQAAKAKQNSAPSNPSSSSLFDNVGATGAPVEA